jgi:hypothetical protein
MTDNGFRNVAGILIGMPAQAKWDDGVAMAYAIALQPFNDDDVMRAVVKLLRTEEFRPAPAAIIKTFGGCHDMGRLMRFIQVVHPSREDTFERLWLEQGKLTHVDVAWVSDNGGWGAIRRGKTIASGQDSTRGEIDGRHTKLISK